jgi:hypothetical protein
MKVFSIFFLLVFTISCHHDGGSSHHRNKIMKDPAVLTPSETDSTETQTQSETQTQTEAQPDEEVVVIESQPETRSSTYLTPVIEIDTIRKTIRVTGHPGGSCGIEFLDGQVMTYELLSPSRLKILMNGKVYKLNRIHIADQNDVYGDWTTVIAGDDFVGTLDLSITRHSLMNVDLYCDKKTKTQEIL